LSVSERCFPANYSEQPPAFQTFSSVSERCFPANYSRTRDGKVWRPVYPSFPANYSGAEYGDLAGII
jgi:hypothetical protein